MYRCVHGSSAISSSFTCSDNRNGYVGRRPDKSSWIKIAPRLFIAPWCPDIHESDKSDLFKLIYINHIFQYGPNRTSARIALAIECSTNHLPSRIIRPGPGRMVSFGPNRKSGRHIYVLLRTQNPQKIRILEVYGKTVQFPKLRILDNSGFA